jgi:hypothetical protein
MAKHAEILSLQGPAGGSAAPSLAADPRLRLVSPLSDTTASAGSVYPPSHEVEQRLLDRELEIARKIQESLLPKTFPELPGFDLAAFCRSARHVGGDFFDVLTLSDGAVLIVVADVMGKGVPAALFAATLRTLLRTMVQWTERPGDLLARINRLMFSELSAVDMFITAQLVVIDSEHQKLTVASAGHCPLLLCRGNQVESVSPEGMPLGIMPDAIFPEASERFDSTTRLLLYTDGVTEARNSDGDCFGQTRLEKWLKQSNATKLTAEGLKCQFVQELNQFQISSIARDDQTWVLLSPKVQESLNPPSEAPIPFILPLPLQTSGSLDSFALSAGADSEVSTDPGASALDAAITGLNLVRAAQEDSTVLLESQAEPQVMANPPAA